MSLSKDESLMHAQSAVSCNLCDNETPGEHFCIECKQTLCAQCELIHRKLPLTKGHKVVLRTQIYDIDTRILTCEEHGEDVAFHCEKCKIPICGKCVTSQHRGHELSDLDILFQRKAEVLQKRIDKMQAEVLPGLNKAVEETRKARDIYDKKVNQIQKQMEEENRALHQKLDKIQSERLKKLKKTKETDLSVFDGYDTEIISRIKGYEGKIEEYQNAVEKGILTDVLEFSKTLRSIPVIKDNPELPKPPLFVAGNMENLRTNVGGMKDLSKSLEEKAVKESKGPAEMAKRQVQESQGPANRGKEPAQIAKRSVRTIFMFTSSLKGWPSISISKKGNVYLGGRDSRQVLVLDKKGKVIHTRRTQQDVLALAVMDSGDIIYTPSAALLESNAVRRLMTDGRERIVFDESWSHICGVSVMADQRILICTYSGKVYLVNGTNINMIYSGQGEDTAFHCIANFEGKFFIADKARSTIVILRRDGTMGRLKQTVTGKVFGELRGLAVDKEGNVLCADKTRHCVYIIDKREQIRRLVDGSNGVHFPRWLAIDDENNLWIAQYEGTIVVLKY